MTERIAVYGGSFSPFTKSHLAVVQHTAGSGRFDRIIVVPSIAHPLKALSVPYEHRVNMANIALQRAGISVVMSVAIVELHLLREQPGPIFTIDVLRKLQTCCPENRKAEFRFVIGPDIIAELDQWEYVEDIRREFGFYEVPNIGAHASMIRELIEAGNPEWARHVPAGVAEYIEMHGLYMVERTTCEHEWESTQMQTFEYPHTEQCAKCRLPRPGSECESWRRAMAERKGRSP